MALPPSFAGGVTLTHSDALPLRAAPTPGANGTDVWGVTLFEAPENGEVPSELIAATLKVYESPLLRPVMVQTKVSVDSDGGQASVVVVEVVVSTAVTL
jgi:hypothetical protein